MRVLVTGSGGMLGRDVVTLAQGAAHEVAALTHEELDVTDAAAVDRTFASLRPNAVINCAAWTDVDAAEDHEREATAVNGEGAGNLAAAAARIEASVVYPSTDYVFNGRSSVPYTERDEADPLSAYGRSKLAGELATIEANPRHFVVRTSWAFGPHGKNFVETMLGLGRERGQVLVVHDQVGCPTYTSHLAAGLLRLIEANVYGIHHMTGEGACSWYEFAQEIFRQAGVDCEVLSATTDMVPRPATRPAYGVLASMRETPITLPPWQRGLGEYLKRRAALHPEGAGA
jgi:dTDP-4-dehydrorhamnose reductase